MGAAVKGQVDAELGETRVELAEEQVEGLIHCFAVGALHRSTLFVPSVDLSLLRPAGMEGTVE